MIVHDDVNTFQDPDETQSGDVSATQFPPTVVDVQELRKLIGHFVLQTEHILEKLSPHSDAEYERQRLYFTATKLRDLTDQLAWAVGAQKIAVECLERLWGRERALQEVFGDCDGDEMAFDCTYEMGAGSFFDLAPHLPDDEVPF